MTSLIPRTKPPDPSPSKQNPFAKRPTATHQPASFSRTSLLPTVPSPARSARDDPLATPADKATTGTSNSVGRGRQGWRLLWRGGLEIGRDGWRLDGITFFAQLSIQPPTPSAQATPNPFDVPVLPSPSGPAGPTSPFPIAPGDTDLCLSLESMRGRKFLQVRGVADLPADEVLEGDDAGAVQMSIAPSAPLLAGYFTGLLCRHPALSPHGRTLSAITIGLGDDQDSPKDNILIYGQRSSENPSQLKLCVGRRRPPPPPPGDRKVRPGEPLPRPPLFFPAKAPKKPLPPFSRRSQSAFSRTSSVSSIYHPPPLQHTQSLPPAPVSGRTPGRRGEKRPRKDDDDDDERRRRGRIVKPTTAVPNGNRSGEAEKGGAAESEADDEDIFGKRSGAIAPKVDKDAEGVGDQSQKKRPRVPQQILDNKATVRKQTMLIMEERGFSRSHELFKDVFGMTTKGVYFALRDDLERAPLLKIDIQRIVKGHLDMYLPLVGSSPSNRLEGVKEESEPDEPFGNLYAGSESATALTSETDYNRLGSEGISEGILTSEGVEGGSEA